MSVIDFQSKIAKPPERQDSEERSYHQYAIQLEHELLDARDALAQMAIDLFICRQRLGDVAS